MHFFAVWQKRLVSFFDAFAFDQSPSTGYNQRSLWANTMLNGMTCLRWQNSISHDLHVLASCGRNIKTNWFSLWWISVNVCLAWLLGSTPLLQYVSGLYEFLFLAPFFPAVFLLTSYSARAVRLPFFDFFLRKLKWVERMDWRAATAIECLHMLSCRYLPQTHPTWSL